MRYLTGHGDKFGSLVDPWTRDWGLTSCQTPDAPGFIMSKLKTPIGLVHETAPRSRSPPLRDQIRYMPAWAAGIYPAVVDETRGIRPRVSHRPDLLNYEGHNPNWNPIPSREVASRTWSSSPKAREDRPQPSIQYSGTTACRSGTQIGFVSGPWRARVCNRWRIDELRRQYKGVAQTSRDLYWPHPQR